MARSTTRLKSKLKKGFRIPSRSIIKSALLRTSKTFLVSLVLRMFSSVPKKTKISILATIDRAPKKSSKKRKAKARKMRVRRSKPKRAKARKKRSKAQIRAQRLRNLIKARAVRFRKGQKKRKR